MTSALVAVAEYLEDGKRLVRVIRVEDDGSVLVEDAESEVIFYLTREERLAWREVRRGA